MTTWFVTGANRGLGLEIARAALDGGEKVVVGARKTASVPPDLTDSDRVLTVTLDVTDPESVESAVHAAIERFGNIDVLVNNAGYGLLGALEEISDREGRALFDVNVFGLIGMVRAVLPGMRKAGSGKVVNIGSRAGFEGGAGSSLYCASKFAVEAVSEALAGELPAFGIQAMVVEPGVFRTDFLDASSLRTPERRLEAYAGTPAHDHLDGADDGNHRQFGDPVKAAALIYRVACGATLPVHLPVGRDAIESLGSKIDLLRADGDRWRRESIATAIEGA